MQEQFTVNNIKCGGCVKAIEQGLATLPGVSAVRASVDNGLVEVEGDGLERAVVARKLAELGYPERT